MTYKVLIPVLAQVDDFTRLLGQLESLDRRQLILVNNLNHPDVTQICEGLAAQGAEYHHHSENLGCAAAWNIGLRQLELGYMDYLIILSPSCNWYNGMERFVELIENAEASAKQDFYLAVSDNHLTDTHAFAMTRQCVERIGLFDENFHPVYFEDTDYLYRQGLVGSYRISFYGLRTSAPLNGGVTKDGRVWDQYLRSADRIKNYYVEKWGGDVGSERFTTPFNHPDMSIKDWTLRTRQLIYL